MRSKGRRLLSQTDGVVEGRKGEQVGAVLGWCTGFRETRPLDGTGLVEVGWRAGGAQGPHSSLPGE